MRGPQRLQVGGDAQGGEARHVGRLDDLQVGDVVPVGGVGALEGVERLAHRPLADGVHVHLEAEPVELGDALAQQGRIHVRQPRAPAQAVGLQGRGGEVLRDAVLHDLDRAGPEPVEALCRRAPRHQLLDLIEPARPVPPQRAHDARPQRPRAGRGQVGGQLVLRARVGAHDGVLPAGDAQREQVPLRLRQRVLEVLGRRAGREQADQVHRALVQDTGRRAGGVALDAAVGGVGRVAGDAGPFERAGVDPGGVVVALDQISGAVEEVDLFAVRQATRKCRHVPAAAINPLFIKIFRRIVGDLFSVRVQPVFVGQIALRAF